MLIRCFFFLLLLVFLPAKCLIAQIAEEDLVQIKTFEDSMLVDAFLVVNDSVPEGRFIATKALILHLKSALRFQNSFDYRFDRLKSISIGYAPDNSFRIFTWQLKVDENSYRYFGAIQMNSPEVNLIPLADRSDNFVNPSKEEMSAFAWYGALYYKMVQIEQAGKPYYLLMGYDALNNQERQKILEVLHFEQGKPVFGAPIIPGIDGEVLHRLILRYHASSSVRLNYDEALELISFDNLITIQGKHGEGPMVVSDGSYCGIKLGEAGLLEYVPKLFNQMLDEAPREEPVLGGTTKDIFGRPKKKNR